jgi:hypothetical protein
MSFTCIALEMHVTHMSTGVKFYWLASKRHFQGEYSGLDKLMFTSYKLHVYKYGTNKYRFLSYHTSNLTICLGGLNRRQPARAEPPLRAMCTAHTGARY